MPLNRLAGRAWGVGVWVKPAAGDGLRLASNVSNSSCSYTTGVAGGSSAAWVGVILACELGRVACAGVSG